MIDVTAVRAPIVFGANCCRNVRRDCTTLFRLAADHDCVVVITDTSQLYKYIQGVKKIDTRYLNITERETKKELGNYNKGNL